MPKNEIEVYEPLKGEIAVLKKFRTPKDKIKFRPGPGGKSLKYVDGKFVIEKLNEVFGMYWDFEVISEDRDGPHITVKGRLTINKPAILDGRPVMIEVIKKTQFGSQSINMQRGTSNPVEIGNDYKAAATDALKKCASMLGIGLDLYDSDEAKNEAQNNVSQSDNVEVLKKQIFAFGRGLGKGSDETKQWVKDTLKIESFTEISLAQAQKILSILKEKIEEKSKNEQ